MIENSDITKTIIKNRKKSKSLKDEVAEAQLQREQQKLKLNVSSGGVVTQTTTTTTSTTTITTECPPSPSLERFSAISKPRESILTQPEMGWGTFNYIAICYSMAGLTMMVDTYLSTGTPIETDMLWWLIRDWQHGLYLLLALFVWSYVNYACTWLYARHKIPAFMSITLYILWQAITFSVAGYYILMVCDLSPILSGGSGLQLCVYSLKNHSYWHTNYFLTQGTIKASKKNSPILRRDLTPNVLVSHFTYFLCVPTLVFETQFPRTKSIRASYLLKEVLACFGTFLMFYLVTCRVSPIYKKVNDTPLLLVLIQLSLPSMSLWMLGFYGVFHCLLNIFAELTRFADREFYQDWWNATTFDQWWRKWNRPVHKWMLRHVYTDSMYTVKMKKTGAMVSTFLLSALLHEMVMIFSFKFVRPILSATMILQIGLVWFTQLPMLQKTRFGNVVMWITVFVGQPLVQLLYSTHYNSLLLDEQQHQQQLLLQQNITTI
ncbi:membrane bound O-acyl transferase family protein [Tieghemostelium lacteum]|uniref:O-acyltransferase n=1 Tax=Tieghemostelium lacteum TaxID=361077 RepID=A0A152A6W4_TIELA|nr:membrane bound O-acyl transferase family protein [Tieghemostelium lacteum]|eukprot:KYR01982.1 membrane bound O-acyl transferase family protein [Tieghemostelium lacteum]